MSFKVKDKPGNNKSALFAESMHVLAACMCGACNNTYEASSGLQLPCFAGLQALSVGSQTCFQWVDEMWHQCAGIIMQAALCWTLVLVLLLLLLL